MVTGRLFPVLGMVSLLSAAVAGGVCAGGRTTPNLLASTARIGSARVLADTTMIAVSTRMLGMSEPGQRSSYWDGIDRVRALVAELDRVWPGNDAPSRAYARGITAYQQGTASGYQEAEGAFREATQLSPDEVVYQYSLGLALLAQQKYPDAELAFRAVRDRADTVAGHHYALGLALLEQQKYADAETAFRLARDKDETVAAHHYALGSALAAQQKHGEAETEFRRVVELDPGAESYYNLGLCLADQQKYEEAATAYQTAIGKKPDDAYFHVALGSARQRQGRYADADTAFRAAARIDPAVMGSSERTSR